jgi:hypothetical protein
MSRYKTNTMVNLVLANGEIRYERLAEGRRLDSYVAEAAAYHGANLLRVAYTAATIDTTTGQVIEITTSHYTGREVAEMVQSRSERRAAERQARIDAVRQQAALTAARKARG